jgi:hypothetical protein
VTADEQAAELEALRACITALEQMTFARALGKTWMREVTHSLSQHTEQLTAIDHRLPVISARLSEQPVTPGPDCAGEMASATGKGLRSLY